MLVFTFQFRSLTGQELRFFFEGLLLVLFGIHQLNISVSILKILLFTSLFILSSYVVYCIQFICATFSFWLQRVGSVQYVIMALDRLTRLPYEVLPKGVVFVIFTFVLPIALVSNIPARALLGMLDIQGVMLAVLSALWLRIVLEIFWRKGLQRYESASS